MILFGTRGRQPPVREGDGSRRRAPEADPFATPTRATADRFSNARHGVVRTIASSILLVGGISLVVTGLIESSEDCPATWSAPSLAFGATLVLSALLATLFTSTSTVRMPIRLLSLANAAVATTCWLLALIATPVLLLIAVHGATYASYYEPPFCP